jgi:hypothetical protein
MTFMSSVDDIALIRLGAPVRDVPPMAPYRGSSETGKTVFILGKGATGNGQVGQYPHSPHRGELRRAQSRVIAADERWITLRFEAPPKALPLEGMPADGDSGGPVLLEVHGVPQLAGLVSRKFASGDLGKFQCCRYGQVTYQVRVSRYAAWIDRTMAAHGGS